MVWNMLYQRGSRSSRVRSALQHIRVLVFLPGGRICTTGRDTNVVNGCYSSSCDVNSTRKGALKSSLG